MNTKSLLTDVERRELVQRQAAEIERLRAALETCHKITQDSMYPAWQALQNIAATINTALANEQKP